MRFRVATVIALGMLVSISTSSAVALPSRLNILIVGKIELRRGGRGNFQAVRAPKRLNLNDVVRSRRGSNAKILCSGFSPRSIPNTGAYAVKKICPSSGPRVLPGGSQGDYLPTRGGEDLLIPFVIAPRKTKILSNTPLIQWNRVPGANEYTVRLLSPDGELWEKTVQGTKVRYPGSPALKRDLKYSIEVRANTGSTSTDEGIPGLAFILIDEGTAQEIATDVELLAEQKLPTEAEAFVLAQIYRQHHLLAEAIALLEAIDRESIQSPATYRLLGDLYRQSRLNRHAQKAYIEALSIAKNNEDLEEKAASLVALGNIHIVLDDIQQAVKYLEEARDLYFLLEGDRFGIVQIISDQLSELSS